MYVVTNRDLREDASGLDMFGETPSREGPNELRLIEVHRRDAEWEVKLLRDKLTPAQVRRLKEEFSLPEDLDEREQHASLRAAARVVRASRSAKRDVLFYVHGFNNDLEAVLERARALEEDFDVQVIAFSWPANGGGVKGVLDYKSDKRDARASAGALDRALAKIHAYLRLFTGPLRQECWQKALRKFRSDPESRDAHYASLLEKACPFSVNCLMHSMGNYLYKNLLLSTASEGTGLIFDNVILASADTNTEDHARWVDRIECRGRVYVTVNEDDYALAASRAKSGREQRARLGHWIGGLDSRQARYVDFTGVREVGTSHAYFGGMALQNDLVSKFFQRALTGRRAEEGLHYDAANNLYRIRPDAALRGDIDRPG